MQQKGAQVPTREMRERKQAAEAQEAEGKENSKLLTMPFTHFALICAAWVSPTKRAERGYYVARKLSETEVVLSVPDKDGHDHTILVIVPKEVAAQVQQYDPGKYE